MNIFFFFIYIISKEFFLSGIHESPKKKGADVFESPQNNLGAEKELQEEKKINKKLKDDLHKSVNEKDDLLKQIKQLDHDHNIYHEKLQDSYEQKLHHLKEDLENSKNNSKGQEEYITHNKLLRKDNEALLKENRELKNFKENTLAENHPEKTKSLLEEKDRRFKNLEILFNNEKENNEIMKERNRQLINENKILQEKPLTHEKDNSEILHEKIKQLANENHILKPKIYELESILTEKSHPNKEVQENLTILSTEINRLQFLIKEKEQQYEKEMKDRENKHMKDLKDKDLKHEKEILDLKKNIQPALKFEIVFNNIFLYNCF